MELFDIAGEEYYFDLKSISDFVKIDEEESKSIEDLLTKEKNPKGEGEEEPIDLQGPMVDMTKWDLTKAMIESILNENGIVDEGMGITKLGEQLSIPFRLSFNTLIKYKLIKKNRS